MANTPSTDNEGIRAMSEEAAGPGSEMSGDTAENNQERGSLEDGGGSSEASDEEGPPEEGGSGVEGAEEDDKDRDAADDGEAEAKVGEESTPDEVGEQGADPETDSEGATGDDSADGVGEDGQEGEEGEEDDDYDPEQIGAEIGGSVGSPREAGEADGTGDDSNAGPNAAVSDNGDDDDDYDPEMAISDTPAARTDQDKGAARSGAPDGSAKSASSEPVFKSKPPVGLPPKPPVAASLKPNPSLNDTPYSSSSSSQLKQAYEAVMQSEIVKDGNFVNLPQAEQIRLISDQLEKRQVNLSSTLPANINYDQVYSYNKPFKTLKSPIPLVPVNEFCRRPNLTAPMSPEEEEDYDEFIKKESHYMKAQLWDEFPDKSRLFIGNLPANTVSKQDLFRIFSKYGEIIQISIKAGYGFVQFRTTEACMECIKGESNVPLHNKIMRLDASRPQKSKKNSKQEFSSRGKERSPGGSQFNDHESANKRRKSSIDCKVYVTGKSSVFFIRKVKKAFSSLQLSIDTEDITHRDLSEVITEAAYSGVLAACIIKEMKVDIQVFENTPDGGIRFDEYADVEPEDAASILRKAKTKKYGQPMPSSFPSSQDSNIAPYSNAAPSIDYGYGNNRRRNEHQDSRRAAQAARYSDRGTDTSSMRRMNNIQRWPVNEKPAPGPSYPDPREARYSATNYGNMYGSPEGASMPVPTPHSVQSIQNPQQNLIDTLKNLDPASMQSMINILQNQQQQQQLQQQQQHFIQSPNLSNAYGNMSRPVNPMIIPQNSPNNQVNALLSQLQNSQPGYNPMSNVNSVQPSLPQSNNDNTTQELMDTLARLSRR